MIFTYDKKTKNIESFKETDFKTHNLLERQDIEKWVESSPEILGEDLLIISTEYDKFDKTNERLDLLAIDKSGILTIIELKRDTSGKNVDLQAVKYAAYCSTLTFDDVTRIYKDYLKSKNEIINEEEATKRILEFIENEDFEEFSDRPRIILVARNFQIEVTSSVLWLRKFELDISCIKLRPYEFEPNKLILESSILIPLPETKDFIIKAEKKENVEHNKNLKQQEYFKFYSELIFKVKEIIPISKYNPAPIYYYQIPTNYSGIHFEWSFHGRPRSSFGIELHFEKSNQTESKKLLKKFTSFKDEIEKLTGENLIIQENWGTRWSRMYIEKEEGKITEDLKSWAVNKMIIFYKFLKPKLDELLN